LFNHLNNCDDHNEIEQAVAHYREALQILRTKSECKTEELSTKKKAFEMELADGGGGKMDRGMKLLYSRGSVQVSVSH
jgi:hypothetical protein